MRCCDAGGTGGDLTHFILAIISLIWTVCPEIGRMGRGTRFLCKSGRKGKEAGVRFFSFFRFLVVLLLPNESCLAKCSRQICYILSEPAASWRNLTQLTCACERPACRNGLEFWAGVQTHRNYHQAWFSSVTESLWASCFVWWSRPPCGLLFCHHCWWYQIFHPGVFADLVR